MLHRRSGSLTRGFACVLVFLSGIAVARNAAAEELPASVTVRRTTDGLTTRLDIAPRDGRFRVDDIVRSLAEVNGLDMSVFHSRYLPGSFSATSWRTGSYVAALNRMLPRGVDVQYVKRRSGPVLILMLDREELLVAKREVKDKVRTTSLKVLEKVHKPVHCEHGLCLDPGWKRRAGDETLVVLIHGFNSTPERTEPLLAPIREAGYPCATFGYPNDQPLDRSARLLSESLKQLAADESANDVTLLTYSMGGLIARCAVEDARLDPGNVCRLVMVAPPNHGTGLARFAVGMDLWEHIVRNDPQRKGLQRWYASLEDGLGEAATDLKPGSVFLTHLNEHRRNPRVRYSILLGTGGPLSKDDLDGARRRLTSLAERSRTVRLFSGKVNGFLADLDEVIDGKGDGAVSVARGRLEGVKDTVVLGFDHGSVVDSVDTETVRKVRGEILKRLSGDSP